MIIKLNTNLIPFFSGTYETQWDITDYNDDGDNMNTVYGHADLMRGIQSEYQNHSEYIVNELNIPFVKKIKFTGVWSPREYNFSTDTLDFDLTVDKKLMIKELKNLEHNKDFNTYLSDKFTSYDGFLSNTPNNYRDLYNQIVDGGGEFEQAVGAFITYLGTNNEVMGEYMQGIEGYIHEDWQGNGYGGTDYWVECWECDTRLEYPFEHECTK